VGPIPRRAGLCLLSLAAAVLCSDCSAPARRAFYYWKARTPPSAEETGFLDRLQVVRLYLRLFDLGPAGEPLAPLDLGDQSALAADGRREIVPVVYVVPEALRDPGGDALRALGARTAREALARCRSAGIAPPELQIDCDWTAGSRENYFRFLGGVREGLASGGGKTVLSATIRLHQVRDREATGVPPADRGLLMAYNLLPPSDPAVRNSILDMEALHPYLEGLRGYPLALDVALPCFSWVVHFEGRRILGLIPYEEAADGLATGEAFRQAGEGWLEAEAGTYLAGRSVERGDRLRIERVDPPLVLAEARQLSARLPRGPRNVAFFSLDMPALEAFSGGSDEAFDGIYSALGAGAVRGP
jgi:hypothetical protein